MTLFFLEFFFLVNLKQVEADVIVLWNRESQDTDQMTVQR